MKCRDEGRRVVELDGDFLELRPGERVLAGRKGCVGSAAGRQRAGAPDLGPGSSDVSPPHGCAVQRNERECQLFLRRHRLASHAPPSPLQPLPTNLGDADCCCHVQARCSPASETPTGPAPHPQPTPEGSPRERDSPAAQLKAYLSSVTAIAPARLRPPTSSTLRICAMLRNASRALSRQSRHASRISSARLLLRPLSTCAVRMAPSSLTSVSPPVSTALPADAFQLQAETNKAGDAEDALFDAQVQQVKEWWASPRYKDIKRPYSAEDVVSKRGALQQTYPSSLMARKLFNLLEERAAEGKPVHTSALISTPSTCSAAAFAAVIRCFLAYVDANKSLSSHSGCH